MTKGTALETVTTGEDGKASYSVDLPISNGYYVSETQAPYAYIRNSKDVYSFNFNVLPETQAKASFSHTFVNDRTTAKIHIYKVDKESGKAVAQGDASLEGAVYGLYARNDIVHPDGATGVVFKAGDLVATLTTDKNGEAEVNNLYLGNYYVKEITPSEGYLLDEEEHDVVCDYEGDLVAEVSRSTTSAEQVIKQPFQLIKVSDNGDDTEAGLLADAEFTAYLKSSLPVKADGSYDFDKATPVVIGENGATTITSDDKGHAVSIAIPYGTYVVVESKTPHNMKTIKPFEVKISENHPDKPQTWRVFLDREFTAKLRVIKKDSDTKQTVLVPNAEFKIFNIDKNEYSEYSAKYLQQLWKKVRKQGGLCTGITQNIVDLLQNYTATTMLANSEFVALLKQANTDSSKMAEVIGVSEAQLRFVTNTSSGMGLIKCGSVVIPFDNQISKDTDLYRLYNTNIHERIEMMKKEKALDKG